jgi:hypothetical protein
MILRLKYVITCCLALFLVSVNSETVSFTSRIVTQDSIYGTYTSSNAETGAIWMVR